MQESAQVAAAVAAPKRVLFILSLQGGRVMAGGEKSSADGIIALAGATNALTGFRRLQARLGDEAILAAAPDVILMMDRQGDQSIGDADILAHPRWARHRQPGRVPSSGGRDVASGLRHRTPEAVAALHAAVYPQAD